MPGRIAGRSAEDRLALGKPFARIDAATTFEEGLALLLDGFERWLVNGVRPPSDKRSRNRMTKSGKAK